METQNKEKRKLRPKNVAKANIIKMALISTGKTQADIARDLKISGPAVGQALTNVSPNRRVNEWVKANLGIAI